MYHKILSGVLAGTMLFSSVLFSAEYTDLTQPQIQPVIQPDNKTAPSLQEAVIAPQSIESAGPLSLAASSYSAQELSLASLDYFRSENAIIDEASGYAVEGFRQKDFTQPTAIGYYALLLANIITGDVASTQISKTDAKTRLGKLLDSLLTDQSSIGYKGLLPWMAFNGNSRIRRPGAYGEQVTLGDNVNLTASLAAAWGALASSQLASDTLVTALRGKIDTFIERQRQGYTYLFDSASGRFRRGWDLVRNDWVGGGGAFHDYFGDEFRGGILFLALRYGFPDSVYTRLQADIRDYTLQDGRTVQTYAMWDGGAFQWLWPSLVMPEVNDPYLNSALSNYVQAALDYSQKNNLAGFLSASYSGTDTYAANAGMGPLTVNPEPRNERVASLYTLGAARPFAPDQIDAFLNQILTTHPDLMSSHGLWEGLDAQGQVVQEQITANVTSFVLGIAGTGASNMNRYLLAKGLLSRLQEIYSHENNIELVASAVSAFSWAEGAITAYRTGGQYQISAANFSSVGTAFIHSGVDLSNQKIRLRYKSQTGVPQLHLELKERGFYNGLALRHQTADVSIPATGGAEQEVFFEIPAGLGLTRIDEILMILSGGAGNAVDFKVVSMEAVPSNLRDLVRDRTGIFTWGNTVTGNAVGDEYTLQASKFTSSGTAFVQNGVNASGAQLRVRYKATSSQAKTVKFELKENTAEGLKIRYEIYAPAFTNTSGQEKEFLFTLPVSANLAKIDEVVMLLSGGTSGALTLTITDLDLRQGTSLDLLTASAGQVTWGGNGVTGAFAGEDFNLTSSNFYSSGTAFIQPDAGIDVSGKKMVLRYRSTTAVGPVKFEFKTRTPNGLQIGYVSPEFALQNTAGQEKEIVINLPAKVELFDIHEVVMLLSGGTGQGLDLKLTGLEISPRSSQDLISQSTAISTKGSTSVIGTITGDDYRIQSSKFSSSTTTISSPASDFSGRQLRIRYKSTTAVGNLKFEFRQRYPNGGGYKTGYTSATIPLANTQGIEQEILIPLPSTTTLNSINEIALILSGGSGTAVDLTLLDLEIL